MRFECNCNNESEFIKMMDTVHNERGGFNFEVGARLWYTPEGLGKTIMVEHQISTQTLKDLTEDDEPDWLTAYEVDDEEDDDCSDELFTETIENNIKFAGLQNAMEDFAEMVFKRCYKEEN